MLYKAAPFDCACAADAAPWMSLLTEDPIAVHTEVRFYHPAVHVLSWLYFATLFWILPISIVGMALFFPVFVVAGIAAGAFRRCVLWVRDRHKRPLSRTVLTRRENDIIDDPHTAAILRDAVQILHHHESAGVANTSRRTMVDANDVTTTHLVWVGVLKFIADQALPTILLVLSLQTALNYVVLALYSGHLGIRTPVIFYLGDPWWWNVVKVEYESRSVACLLSTIAEEFSDGTQDVGHMWQIISAVVPFA